METPVENIISQWKSYLTNISTNLMELSDQTEYQLIKSKASDTANGYTGITREKAEGCMETVGALWRHYAILSEVLEKAISLNNRRSLLYNSGDDIMELLERTQLVVDKEHVDINERNLLSSENIEKKATPKELLKQMQEAFKNVCGDIAEISKAEETVRDRLYAIKKDISRLNSTVKRLGIANAPVFDTDRVEMIERDPLQGMLELDRLVYSIEKYRASIKEAEKEYDQIVSELEKIRSILNELKDLAAKSSSAARESTKIFSEIKGSKPVIGDDVIKSLEDWLHVLENKLSQGPLRAVKIGASRLEKECSLKLETEKENYDINSRAYNEWLDLKGQFRSLLVKADILKAKGLLADNSLDELIKRTDAALHADPVDIECCRELVGKFRLSL